MIKFYLLNVLFATKATILNLWYGTVKTGTYAKFVHAWPLYIGRPNID